MHTFQPYPMNMLEFNPFQKIGNEWAAVTAEADGKANAMTVSWGGVGGAKMLPPSTSAIPAIPRNSLMVVTPFLSTSLKIITCTAH